MTLLFDFYGSLLTEKQQTYFDLYYNQDFSLGEIAEQEGISRQGVHDAINRAESILQQMEKTTGCVERMQDLRNTMDEIRTAAQDLLQHQDIQVRQTARRILSAVSSAKE
jgi:predicted DNA-binding protein YlxM (UPF0122 family)